MKLLFGIILWLLVFSLSPLIALVALVLLPIVWLVTIPFRLVGICTDAIFEFLRALLFLPSRLLGMRTQPK
jgi:hypothetical protein